jgi:hypothetical protein
MPRILGQGAFFPYDADYKDLRKLYDKDAGDVATLRKYGAKYGKGVGVELGITNVETQSDFETQLRGWNATDGDNNIGGTALTEGWRRFPVMGPTTTNTQIYHPATYSVSAGQRYTMQCLFRFDGSRPTFDLRFEYVGAADTDVTPTVTHLGKGVWHAMATHVVPSGATSFRGLNLSNLSWGSSTRIDLVEPVLHLHAGVHASVTVPIRTSHVWGTRANGLLRYPGWLLPRREGTISCWIRPNYDFVAFPSADYHGIVTSTTTPTSDQFQLWIMGDGTGRLRFETYAGGSLRVDLDYQPAAWDPGLLHHIACSWSDVEQVLYLDGVRRDAQSGNFARWSEAGNVTIGTASTPATANDWLDGLIDDLAIFPRQLTDAQVATIYA